MRSDLNDYLLEGFLDGDADTSDKSQPLSQPEIAIMPKISQKLIHLTESNILLHF